MAAVATTARRCWADLVSEDDDSCLVKPLPIGPSPLNQLNLDSYICPPNPDFDSSKAGFNAYFRDSANLDADGEKDGGEKKDEGTPVPPRSPRTPTRKSPLPNFGSFVNDPQEAPRTPESEVEHAPGTYFDNFPDLGVRASDGPRRAVTSRPLRRRSQLQDKQRRRRQRVTIQTKFEEGTPQKVSLREEPEPKNADSSQKENKAFDFNEFVASATKGVNQKRADACLVTPLLLQNKFHKRPRRSVLSTNGQLDTTTPVCKKRPRFTVGGSDVPPSPLDLQTEGSVCDDPEFERRVQFRKKQLSVGKSTIGYIKYKQLIPITQRTPDGPWTPDVMERVSKRAFDGKVLRWRCSLHQYDSVVLAKDLQSPAVSEASTTCPSAQKQLA